MSKNFQKPIDIYAQRVYNVITVKDKEKSIKTRRRIIMKNFKIDVMWNNEDCLDPDAVQDYIEAENEEEAEELAKDYLIECGADEEEIAYIIATEI